MLVNYAAKEGKDKAEELLHTIFKNINALNPSKNAVEYWYSVNKTILNFSKIIQDLWQTEKEASFEAVLIAKEEGIRYLTSVRERIMKMSHDEALKELLEISNVESKIKIISSISDNGLFGIR